MDTVRFGRALGVGVREAAKAAVKAAEAAASPSPTSPLPPPPKRQALLTATIRQTRRTGQGVRQGSRQFGKAVWNPFARLSTVLWHEVTGVLYSLFALICGLEAWHGRAAILEDPGRVHEWVALGLFAIFAFFTASSFRKASRRQRR